MKQRIPRNSAFAGLLAVSLVFTTLLRAQDFKKQVIYQIVTDRFFDGDTSNDNPSESPGLYDSTKTNWFAYWAAISAASSKRSPISRDSAPPPSGSRLSSATKTSA